MEAVEKATGEREVNFIGYCLGGTLLGATLGFLAAKGIDSVKAATFFVSLLDFDKPGELGVFIDEPQVESLERKMNERGYLEGSEMASTFSMLRANDLVWSFVINNYLLGKDPFPFDLLYWNADSTRMPARMHSFYLRNMYIKNSLGVPGGISLAGVPIDLSSVKIPAYFISTVEQVSLLDQRCARRDGGRMVRRREAGAGVMVGRLAAVDRPPQPGREGAGADPEQRHRGCARQLRDAAHPREGQFLKVEKT
jgi:polyhydroxyalkanoate synthase